ncbi:MAG: hypothetical protein KAX31_02605, partial [Thermoplasmata archaeon]|nr:hypothetical protein [Thermoplasmata archaeon]
MIYNTTGLELEEWWLYLPNENIINCSLYVSVEGEWIPLSEGGDYTLNYTTGNLTMLIGAPDPGWEFYAYYNYTITPVLLVMPGDYTLVYTTGAITLITPLVAGEYLTANYSWYIPIPSAQLSHGNISACTLYLNGTVFANYELNSTTGLITFTPTLGPGDVVNASYDWYVPTLIQSALLNHTNIMPGSYTLYLNGTVFANYELNSTTGLITFTPTLGPGDVVNASYDWYVPTIINSALLENTNIVSGSCVLYNNTVVFTEYSIDLLSGAIFFDEPLWPGSSITADYSYYAHTITIPVLVNVPADRPEFTFGGGESTLGLFNNNEMIGGYGAGGQSGDWRFYYVDVADQGLNRNEDNLMKFFLNASWNLKPSDIDIFVFGKTAQTTVPGTGDALPSGRYGPYTLKDNGGSEETDEFYTTTNSSHEIITTPFTGGLNVVALHNTLINGTSSSEDVSGEVGWIRLSTDMLETRTNSLYGDASFSLVSNREFPEGMNVSAVGPASGEKTIELVDQDPVDWIESNLDFYHALTEGASLTKVIKVESVLTLDVHVWPVDEGMVPDVDLGMCYDANEDGVPTYEELVTRDFCDFISYRIDGYQPFQCSCADWDADEAVKLISPPDGQYIICVLGYEVKSPPQEVNLEIKAIRAGVEGFGMTGDVGEDIDIQSGIYTTNTSIPAFQTHTYSISWNFPGSTLDGEYGGVVGIGPSIAPSVLSILANLVLDRESPEITGPQPSDLSLIRENQPVIMATIEDLSRAEIDAEGLKLYVDGIDVTPLASISVELDDEFGGGGYPRGIVTYTPNAPLSEGGHSVELVASDLAGNEVTRTWMFTIDTLAPALTISSDDPTYVNTPSATLQGTVETGCDLTISGVQG